MIRKLSIGTLCALLVMSAGSAAAHEAERPEGGRVAESSEAAQDINTDYIFGFTHGSEIGKAGEVEIEAESVGRIGARAGSYSAFSSDLALLYTLTDHFRIAPILTVDSFRFRGIPGVDDRANSAFEGPAVELKYRFLDYKSAPFGLYVGATPFYSGVEPLTGEPIRQAGSTFVLGVDRALIPDRVFGALNVNYGLSRTFSSPTGLTSRDSSLGASGALSLQVAPGTTIGGELRYVSTYDGLGLNHAAANALYAGPTFYSRLGEKAFVSAGLNVRLRGDETIAALRPQAEGALDPAKLTGFERYQIVVRVGYEF